KTLSYLCASRPLLLAMPLDNLAARITRDNRAGLTVAPTDLEGFLSAAAELHASAPLCSELAANARNYAEATFPIAKTAAVFDRILAS
ncbi:MAG: glycosyltransferase WbuB, partial [Verrucomicrobiaceae bacterium]